MLLSSFSFGSALKLVYTGGTVTPSGWSATGGTLAYASNEVFLQNTATVLSTTIAGDLDGILTLTQITGLVNVNFHNNLITSVSLAGLASLEVITGDDNDLTSLDITGCPLLATVTLDGNNFNSAAVDAVLVALAAGSVVNGNVHLAGTGMSAPTGTGIGAKGTLEGRGWTVNVN